MKAWLSILPMLCALLAPAARAEVTVDDAWEKNGRLVVEVRGVEAVFARRDGAVVFHLRTAGNRRELARIVPYGPDKAEPSAVASCKVVERAAGAVRVEAAFPAGGGALLEAVFTFAANGDLEVAPKPGMRGVSIRAPIAWGVLPGVVPDDVVYDPAKHDLPAVHIPAEGAFFCLLRGENDLVALAWLPANQELRLVPAGSKYPLFKALELDLDGRSAWVGLMTSPGIWHREPLSSTAFMEKSVELKWRRPFPAAWKTQLAESGVPTSFTFANHEEGIWRPDTGSYTYPAWFKGDRAILHLGAKIPPEGDALIYAPDGHELTPLALMKRCSPGTAALLAGIRERRDYLPPRRQKTNVGYWHCWGTAMVKRTVYKYGMQAREGAFLVEHLDNYLDLEESNQARHQQYLDFAAMMRGRLDSWSREAGDPALKSYLERMTSLLDRLVVKVKEPMEEMTPADYMKEAEELGRRLKVITAEGGTEDYPEFCHIVERLNSTSAGMHEEVGKWFGTCARDWYQQAAYACVDRPGAVKFARDIRQAIREVFKTRNWEVIDAPDW